MRSSSYSIIAASYDERQDERNGRRKGIERAGVDVGADEGIEAVVLAGQIGCTPTFTPTVM
jgi:hypothetical protein